jgi:hypothetical protein
MTCLTLPRPQATLVERDCVARVVRPSDFVARTVPAAPRHIVARGRRSTTRQLILGEQVGHRSGDAVISADQVKEAPDRSVGWHVDEFPEAAAVANSAGGA